MAEVELPQLGESVTEGIITAWLVEVGDTVAVDQPLVEISTDKVDTEIPSPVAGTVTELRAEVDDTIEVGQVIAVVGDDAAEPAGDDAAAPAGDDAAEPAGDDAAEPAGDEAPVDDTGTDGPAAASSQPAPASEPASTSASGGQVVGEKALTSPLVRRLLREAGLTPAQVTGTGAGGRITREDAERAIAAGGEGEPTADTPAPSAPAAQKPTPGTQAPTPTAEAPGPSAPAATPTPTPASVTPAPIVAAPTDRSRPEAAPVQVDFGGQDRVTQPLTRVRKAIARSMLESITTTAQLTAAVEVDLTAIMNLRAAKKDAFKAAEGASLSPLPMIARAVCMTIPRHPALNASIDTDAGTATFHRTINLGMAIDTDRGLLVPNIKSAQDLNVSGLARRIGDLAARTRNKKLQPDEISGGTFTITNTGSRGTLFDTPILNPPEVAILATCTIEKRPVVVSDAYGDSIAIRWMSYLCLTYDHRMVDGADAARFLADLRYTLETHDWAGELPV